MVHVKGAIPATGALQVLVPKEALQTVTPGLSREAAIATDTIEVDRGVTVALAGAVKCNAIK